MFNLKAFQIKVTRSNVPTVKVAQKSGLGKGSQVLLTRLPGEKFSNYTCPDHRLRNSNLAGLEKSPDICVLKHFM